MSKNVYVAFTKCHLLALIVKILHTYGRSMQVLCMYLLLHTYGKTDCQQIVHFHSGDAPHFTSTCIKKLLVTHASMPYQEFFVIKFLV